MCCLLFTGQIVVPVRLKGIHAPALLPLFFQSLHQDPCRFQIKTSPIDKDLLLRKLQKSAAVKILILPETLAVQVCVLYVSAAAF